MTHSTSFPVHLCSSPYNRAAIQPSSSFTSSLSTASSYHSWSQAGNRHLYPTIPGPRSERSCRSPSSPAARQLAAELDELRRLGNETHASQTYSTASLPRGMGHKVGDDPNVGEASSTLALPTKKYSMTSAASAVESDDEVARGGRGTATSSRGTNDEKPLKRDRTRSSIRNLFMKLTRSTSQEQNGAALKKSGTSRSASSVRFTNEPLSGGVELFPPLSHFVDWRSEQLAEWMGEVGFAQYVPEVSKYVRSGRHFLNMNIHEYEIVLGIKSPLHRKRLNLLLRRIENDSENPAHGWDVQQTQKWLEDIGLPQYKEVFSENLIDGLMFPALTAADLTESIVTSYPQPNAVVHWTHAATCEWLRKIDLAEFTPNLLCAGTPGALMVSFLASTVAYVIRFEGPVYEPTFTAETLAEILQMPPHKTLLRRHLTTHFNQLLGQKIVAEKRDTLAMGNIPQLVPGTRIRVSEVLQAFNG
uniref:SAM domain-containing protein n=1 Tax=Heligmosomoides polygyrus TaxID=6339 RepID=A0A183G503_HELPZ